MSNSSDIYEPFQLTVCWSDITKKIQMVSFCGVCKIASLPAYKIFTSALEAYVEDAEDQDQENDAKSQGDYESDFGEFFTSPNSQSLELLIDIKGPKVKRFQILKLGKLAILKSCEDYEVLQIDVKRSLGFIEDQLKMSKSDYTEKLNQSMTWAKLHGTELAEKSFMMDRTAKRRKEKEFCDYLHMAYEPGNEKSVLDFGSAINFKPDVRFDQSFDKIFPGSTGRDKLGSSRDQTLMLGTNISGKGAEKFFSDETVINTERIDEIGMEIDKLDSAKWIGSPDPLINSDQDIIVEKGPVEEGGTHRSEIVGEHQTPDLEHEIENTASIDQTNGEESVTGYQDSPQKQMSETSPQEDPEPQAEPQQEEPKPTAVQTEAPQQTFTGLPEPQNFGTTQLKIDIPSMEVSDPREHVSFRHDFQTDNY
jgi:hypothetical protein